VNESPGTAGKFNASNNTRRKLTNDRRDPGVTRVYKTWMSFIIGLLAIGMLAQGEVSAQSPKPKSFTDVTSDHWANDYVYQMVELGIVDGYQDGTFLPDGELTREQFAKLLTLALDQELSAEREPTFSDVQDNRWSYLYIESVKEYLEGYQLPIGKPFYEPDAIITREDVAVALVKGLGIDIDSIDDPKGIIRQTFDDYGDFTSGIEPYVAAAIQNNFLSGYQDGTFQPKGGLTRGAAAALLGRLIETPGRAPMEDIPLTVRGSDQVNKPVVKLSGTSAKGVKLYVNDDQTPNYGGTYEYVADLDEKEGTYVFEVKAVKANGRYKSQLYSVNLKFPSPELRVDTPSRTEEEVIIVKGYIRDINDTAPALTINGDPVNVQENGQWSHEVTLKGGKNTLAFEALNKYQKQSTINRDVEFAVPPPSMIVRELESEVYYPELRVSGTVLDKNDASPKVTLNGRLLSDGSFNKSIQLKEGENALTFRAVNRLGGISEVTKTVKYIIKPPEVKLDNFSEYSIFKEMSFGIEVSDIYDENPSIYINGSYAGRKSYSKTVSLSEGENKITIKAVSTSGKETVLNKTIMYTVLPPNISEFTVPETTDQQTFTVRVSASDLYDKSPRIYINGSYVSTSSAQRAITLTEGRNNITVKVTSTSGKEMSMTKPVIFAIPAPVIAVDSLPSTVTSPSLRIRATATDANDSYPQVYLEGESYGSSDLDRTITLKEGTNRIVIVAKNRHGKTSSVTKEVLYTIPGPTLSISNVPDTVQTGSVSFTVTASDPNDASPTIYVNGEAKGKSSVQVQALLTEGNNTFSIYAMNRSGKVSETSVKNVRYSPVVEQPQPPQQQQQQQQQEQQHQEQQGKERQSQIQQELQPVSEFHEMNP
jgi:hypothetical protein